MAQNRTGTQQANEQLIKRREEAREEGLAEQNVTGATPPDVESEAGEAGLPDRNATRTGNSTRRH